jgi:cell division protein FtsW
MNAPIPAPQKLVRGKVDALWLFCLMLLMAVGVIGNFSASSLLSLRSLGDEYYFLKKHLMFMIAGTGLFFAGLRISLDFVRKWTYLLLAGSWALVWLTLIPGVGHRAGGAARWLEIGPLVFQPSEIFKIAIVLYLAHSMAKKNERISEFSKGFLPHIILAALAVVPLLLQPDFGTTLIIGLMTLVMLFLAGARFAHLFLVGLFQFSLLAALVMISPYRLRRITAFLDPWADAKNKGYQIIQSMVAFYNGGLSGVGLGNSQGKLFYLPAAHTDFILAVFAEELGFVGVAAICILFIAFFARTVNIAGRVTDLYRKLLVLGFAFQLILQMLINAFVVTGLLPTKGLTLPFISSGGSSLMMTLFICGLIANVSSHHEN